MADISAQLVKELRDKTGAGIMDCKEALQNCDGDLQKAVEFLRKKGIATAEKRAGRAASEGVVQSYIHMGGKIGVLVEVNCETDFVARNEDFQDFVKNLAMHIAAANPMGIAAEDIPAETITKEKEILRAQAEESGKPANVLDKIVEGRINKFYKENCLLNQQYVKNPDVTIQDYMNEVIGKTGEKIVIRRFARYQVGAA